MFSYFFVPLYSSTGTHSRHVVGCLGCCEKQKSVAFNFCFLSGMGHGEPPGCQLTTHFLLYRRLAASLLSSHHHCGYCIVCQLSGTLFTTTCSAPPRMQPFVIVKSCTDTCNKKVSLLACSSICELRTKPYWRGMLWSC